MVHRYIVRGSRRRWNWSLGAQNASDGLSGFTKLLHPLGEDALFIRLGMFALVAVGLHAGANQLDDEIFFVLNAIDQFFDQMLTGIIKTIEAWFPVSAESSNRAIYKVVEFVDLDTKKTAAQYLALIGELAAVIMLALPLLWPQIQAPPEGYRPFSQRWWTDPSFARYGVPLAVAAAAISGLLVITNTTQSASHAFFVNQLGHSGFASLIAQTVGGLTLLGVFWFIFIRCFEQVLVRIDHRARNDIMQLVSARQRRFRGFWRCLIALPVSLLAIYAAPSLFETIGSILGG